MNKLTGVLVGLIVVLALALSVVSVTSLKGVFAENNSANMPSVEEKTNDPSSLEKYETVSIDASTKLVYKEYAIVDEVYFDDYEKKWYVLADDWALEGESWTAVKDLVDQQVKIEYYIVEGHEIVHAWNVVQY